MTKKQHSFSIPLPRTGSPSAWQCGQFLKHKNKLIFTLAFLIVGVFFFALTTPLAQAGHCECTPLSSGVTCPPDSDIAPSASSCNQACGISCTGSYTETSTSGASTESDYEKQAVEKGLGGALDLFIGTAAKSGFNTLNREEPEIIIGKIIQGLMLLIGVIFGILVIYGGYYWMIARGNEEYVKKAVGILQTAIIGLIVVVAAYAITSYVINQVITASFAQ